MNFTDQELAAVAKSCDVHRQSLMKRMTSIDDSNVRAEMSAEIDACDSASTKAKTEQRRRLSAA